MTQDAGEVEEYLHRCDTPGAQPLPDDVSRIIYRWKCPVCRQKWRITSWESNSQAVPYGWRWRRWRPALSGSPEADQ